ncbi:hypothetical protein B1N38_15625 [Listeria monocytogenes]|nr:hypothetical protein [Listeria monocytogenes]EAC5359501.1 hypothetical protein [Listeria monocytogenes]EAC5408103.1 hypothetical protein [Listeria monocytogenes]EAC5475531.1 hypothetical protein [Listeria monocytogenes]EAC9287449.1 hypothetical protein [Listeria monocytogenes]
MSDNQKRFSELYKSREGEFNEEMQELFNKILADEFKNDPLLMDAFIYSLYSEITEKEPTELEVLKQENKQLQEDSEMIQTAFMELSDYVFSK